MLYVVRAALPSHHDRSPPSAVRTRAWLNRNPGRRPVRVKVHAGIAPLSGRRHYRTETIPAGPRALAEAKKVRTRLIGQVDEQRNPRTRATVDQLVDRYLDPPPASMRQ